MYISNDIDIYLYVVVNQLAKYKQNNNTYIENSFLIVYIKESKYIIYPIEIFPEK
jgi:hypothetical protein